MRYFSFDDQITIYWLLDEHKGHGPYELFLNGRKAGETPHSHFSFRGLEPSSEYLIEVKERGTPFASLRLKTRDRKRDVVIFPKKGKEETKEIQAAIDSLKEGERLFLKKGTHLSGALYLHSGNEIYLEKGAILLGSPKAEDYLPKVPSRFEGHERMTYASLINIGTMNHEKEADTFGVTIRGEGEIRGGGDPLSEAIIAKELPNLRYGEGVDNPVRPEIEAGRSRGRLIAINNAKGVVIDGLKLGYGASWNVHMIYSSDVVTSDCFIESFGIHNGDGWDPDSSHDCFLFGTTFNTGDDCIAIKSGKNPEGNAIGIPCHDIHVFDCRSIRGHGCAIGSELSGGIYSVDVFDCDFTNTIYGIHIKTTRKRGGYCKDVRFFNVRISSINIDMVPYNDDGVGAGSLSEFSSFSFEGISLSGIMYEDDGKTDSIRPITIKGFEDEPGRFHDFAFRGISFARELSDEEAFFHKGAVNVTFLR